jgi:hypothetical protein
VRGSLSKFEACLPGQLLLELWARSVLDVDGARAAVSPAERGRTGKLEL